MYARALRACVHALSMFILVSDMRGRGPRPRERNNFLRKLAYMGKRRTRMFIYQSRIDFGI